MRPAPQAPASLILICAANDVVPAEFWAQLDKSEAFGSVFAFIRAGSANPPEHVHVIPLDAIDRKSLRRMQFFAEREDFPSLLAPLLIQHVWNRKGTHSVILRYTGVTFAHVAVASGLLQAGCDAVMLRREEKPPLVFALARHLRNERLLAHWKRCAEQAPFEFGERRGRGQRIASEIVENLCTLVAAVRASKDEEALIDGTEWPAEVLYGGFVGNAIRTLLPEAPSLWEDPVENAVAVLNAPSQKVKQDAQCVITNAVFLAWTARLDLHSIFDLETPAGRRGLVEWFLNWGSKELQIPEEFVTPVRAAAPQQPVALPRAAAEQGVNLIGYPRAEMGMGELIRSSAAALSTVGTPFALLDFPFEITASQRNTTYEALIGRDHPFDINIFHINADLITLAREKLGPEFFRGRYNVGYWAWELAEFPDEWMSALDLVDEVWAISRFMRDAIAAKTSKPVIWMPLAVEFAAPSAASARNPRQSFALPEDDFLFLFAFDFSSFPARKNFTGLIEAFRNAFPDPKASVGLVLKTIRHPHQKRAFWELLRAIGDDHRIVVLEEILPQARMRELIAACDSFVSLHRAEGFGLSIAEAMYLGKPIITTNYSGNTDFTRPNNSCLVDYQLIPIQPNEYPFGDRQVWADPNLDQAAEYMRRLVKDRQYAANIGRAAAAFIRAEHNRNKIGDRLAARLSQVRKAREAFHDRLPEWFDK